MSSMIEPAKFVTKSPAFKWATGMRTQRGWRLASSEVIVDDEGLGAQEWFFLSPDDELEPVSELFGPASTVLADEVPDLTDAATAGCLFDMLVQAKGEATIRRSEDGNCRVVAADLGPFESLCLGEALALALIATSFG